MSRESLLVRLGRGIVVGCPFCGDRKAKTPDVLDPDDYEVWFAMLFALADACRSLVAAIEQIHVPCQTREQRSALIIGREALAALQRLESAGRVGDGNGDTTAGRGAR